MAKPAGVIRHEHFFEDEDSELGRVDACELDTGEFLTWDVDEDRVLYCESWEVATSTAYSLAVRKRVSKKMIAELGRVKKRKKMVD